MRLDLNYYITKIKIYSPILKNIDDVEISKIMIWRKKLIPP